MKTRKKKVIDVSDEVKAKEKKDPVIAALIGIVGMVILGAPAIGYFYLGNAKKGIIYLAASWLVWIIAAAIYFVGSLTIIGILVCLPIFIIPLILNLIIVWDVYLEASGEPTKLP